jgi:alkylhydroperoxidase/carboxymuconolactone decarboxylase family protein YurZ
VPLACHECAVLARATVYEVVMKNAPKPPKAYEEFVQRYPRIAEAWDTLAEAGKDGPLDERTRRLVKLAIAVGAMRQGAVHSNVRKALAGGVPREAIEQVIALAAGTIGLPSAVAIYTWVQDAMISKKKKGK